MIKIKRHSTNSKSSKVQTQKYKKASDGRQSASCFEDLSNEVYYEIFDYLEGCKLYEAFSNLNQRFQNLLTCSALTLKIDLGLCSEEVAQRRYTDIVIPNRHKIISLHLKLYLRKAIILSFNYFPIDSSLTRLESLTLDDNIESKKLIRLLFGLSELPRLLSLTIYCNYGLELVNLIYKFIFRIPRLKYNQFSVLTLWKHIRLPIATNDQVSGIEHLVIGHECTFNELIVILSYTPRLFRLSCTEVKFSAGSNRISDVNTVWNLTHISIGRCYADFDRLERFVLQKSPQLQVLRLGDERDLTYLDADRWERLISQYLTHLRIFDLKYKERIDEDLTTTTTTTQYHERINRFDSSFWIDRNWLLRLEIDIGPDKWIHPYAIIYSISSNRKNSQHFHENKEVIRNCFTNGEQDIAQDRRTFNEEKSITFPIAEEMNQLVVTNFPKINRIQHVVDLIGSILTIIQIRYLDIRDESIFIDDLFNLIKYLPNLDSLVVSSLSMTKLTDLSVDERRNLRLVSTMNKISKVKLYQMNSLAQGRLLLNLCSSMRYFEVDCTNVVDPKRFVQFILTRRVKDNPNLSSLCLEIPPENKNTMKNLKKMIDTEQLCQNYTIKQKDNRIYLKWT